MTFNFAKVWAADKDGDQEMAGTAEERAQEDAWAQTLAHIAEERLKAQAKEETGPRKRRAAAPVFPQVCAAS